VDLPELASWTGPMAWTGDPLRPVDHWSGEYPIDARFVRGFFHWTLRRQTAPGTWSESQVTGPALIRLEAGKPVQALGIGPDGGRWDYRLEKRGRKKVWTLESASQLALTVEFAVLQSLLPEYGSGKYISLRISGSGQVENFATAIDPG